VVKLAAACRYRDIGKVWSDASLTRGRRTYTGWFAASARQPRATR